MTDVAVVGAGIVGLACAHEIAERGARVTVLDGAGVGAGASHGNTGWVVPSLSMPLASPGMLATGLRAALNPRGALVIRPALELGWVRWLWQFGRCCRPEAFRRGVLALVELNRLTLATLDRWEREGIEFESHATGMLVVARDRRGLTWFSSLHTELRRAGFEGTLTALDAAQARELEPALSGAVGCALHSPVDRHVEPASLLRGLAEHVRARGVTIREGAQVVALTRGSGGWTLTLRGGEHARAQAVVVAAGSATGALLRPLGTRLALIGAKGYSVDVTGEGLAPRTALYLSEPKLGISPFDGGVRIAGVFELPGRDTSVSPTRIAQLLADAHPYLRSWRPAAGPPVPAGWAGLRPATPDGLPLLGPIDGMPGLYVASGHGMLGVTLAPASAVAIAAMLDSGRVPAELEAFRPLRAA